MRSTIQAQPSPVGLVLTYEHAVDRPRLGLVPVLPRTEYAILAKARCAWAWEHRALAQAIWPGARVVQVHDAPKVLAVRQRAMGNRSDFKKRAAWAPPAPEEE